MEELFSLLFTSSFQGAAATGMVIAVGLLIPTIILTRSPKWGFALSVFLGTVAMVLLNPWTAVLLVALAVVGGLTWLFGNARTTFESYEKDRVVKSERRGLPAALAWGTPMPGDDSQQPINLLMLPPNRQAQSIDVRHQLADGGRREN